MKFYRYWAKGIYEATAPDGTVKNFSCWGFSDESKEDARKNAERRARAAADAALSSRDKAAYFYSDRPLREEVIEEIKNPNGETLAAITRNACGCLVLNCANAMFADVDYPVPSVGQSIARLIKGLLGFKTIRPRDKFEAEVVSNAERIAKADPKVSIRIYRTKAGMRVFFAEAPIDPLSSVSVKHMNDLKADPLYMKLCAAQRSFRARLTPKPWRCGMPAPPVRFPFETGEARAKFDKWLSSYESAGGGNAVCAFVASVGSAAVYPDFEPLIKLHDERTKAFSNLPLA